MQCHGEILKNLRNSTECDRSSPACSFTFGCLKARDLRSNALLPTAFCLPARGGLATCVSTPKHHLIFSALHTKTSQAYRRTPPQACQLLATCGKFFHPDLSQPALRLDVANGVWWFRPAGCLVLFLLLPTDDCFISICVPSQQRDTKQ
jgi:hypothetical protein